MQWISHHNVVSKYGVINTLTHSAKAVCSTPQQLKEEFHHLQEVQMRCKYPSWATNKVLLKQDSKVKSTKKNHNPVTTHQSEKKCHIIVPYWQGLCASYKSICKNIENKYISKEDKPWKISWYHQKIRTLLPRKVMSYAGSSVTRLSVKISI